jgi:hypothetical protein
MGNEKKNTKFLTKSVKGGDSFEDVYVYSRG